MAHPPRVPATLILSDLHLHPEGKSGTSARAVAALVPLLRAHPEAALVLAGDIFDLTLVDSTTPLPEALVRLRMHHEPLFQELERRLRAGGEVSLVPGNHDAALLGVDAEASLRAALQTDAKGLRIAPWFHRLGDIHVEHGHQFDADNAFLHPLAPHNPSTEPLGTALMRRFVGPSQAYVFAHGHETTLLSGLRLAFGHFGPKAPQIVVSYFRTAFGLLLDAAQRKAERRAEVTLGEARLLERAHELGMGSDSLARMASLSARPRHDSLRQTWMRLYFDRVVAASLLLTPATALTLGQGAEWALAPGALGALYLAYSLWTARERYGTGPGARLAAGAAAIRHETGARLVVMGHSHEVHVEPGYINLGSFTFPPSRGAAPRSRPFVGVDSGGHATLSYVNS